MNGRSYHWIWLWIVALFVLAGGSLSWSEDRHLVADPLAPLPEQDWDLAKARHLLFRAGFGGSPEDIQRLYEKGLAGAVRHLVYFEDVPPVDLPPPQAPQLGVSREELRKMTEQERMEAIERFRRREREYLNAVRVWWVRLMMTTQRPLEEKMTLFWHGHFASDFRTVERPEAMYNQNVLFRQHAVGNFGHLVHGIVRDPAMLRYLDNHRNVAGRPNENLARELMELFTMGEGNGYTERDIAEGARALSGYSFDRESLQFVFLTWQHDRNVKTIFGQTGRWNGDQLVDLILSQPATSQFIARKLFQFFVHDQPTDVMVSELAQTLRENDYELRPLLVKLFMSAEFYSPHTIGRQIKSPADLTIGTIRALRVNADPVMLFQAMRSMGQELFNPPNVRGWEGGAAWINSNTLFARQNFVAAVILNDDMRNRSDFRRREVREAFLRRTNQATNDWIASLQTFGVQTPAEIVDHYLRLLVAPPVSPEKRTELVEFLGDLSDSSAWSSERRAVNRKISELLILITTLPEYQMN